MSKLNRPGQDERNVGLGSSSPATTPALDLADGSPSVWSARRRSPAVAPATTTFLAEIADLYDEDVRDWVQVRATNILEVRQKVRDEYPGWYCRTVRAL